MSSYCSYLRIDHNITKLKSKVHKFEQYTALKLLYIFTLEKCDDVCGWIQSPGYKNNLRSYHTSQFCFLFTYMSFAFSFLSLGSCKCVVYQLLQEWQIDWGAWRKIQISFLFNEERVCSSIWTEKLMEIWLARRWSLLVCSLDHKLTSTSFV